MSAITLFPKQTEAMELVQSEKYNFILYGGAIRGGKSVWGLAALLIMCEVFPRSRWCVIREDMEKIRTTTIPSFTKFEPKGRLKQSPYEYTHPNGSVIMFKSENYASDKDINWMKGLEVNGFLFEEINECEKQTLFKAFERAGAWIIPNSKVQPKPIILATCNPTNGWLKDLVYEKDKNGTLPDTWAYIPAKITDNPALPKEYIDNLKNLPRYEYEVFVEGNWDVQLKTGSEFLKSFELDTHVSLFKYNPELPIHISIDSNVFPYIAITMWQLWKIDNVFYAVQFHELPCVDPENTARKAGINVAKYLLSLGYKQRVFLYGDRSTKSRNNIDDDKRSFAEIFTESIKEAGYIVQDCMLNRANPVNLVGDFVNHLFEKNRIKISETCKKSINDYIETKQDKDGGILKKRITDGKTGISYEPNGHLTDTLKDFIVSVFNDEFLKFQNRFAAFAPQSIEYVKRTPKVTY